MAKHEADVKLNVDTTQLDEVIEKAKQLEEDLWVVNGLLEELADENTIEIKIDTIRY